MTKCMDCDKPLTQDEAKECMDSCFECDRSYLIGRLGHHMSEARVTFEEVIRKLLSEVDK